MRVLIVSRSLNYGGAERQLVALATGLQQRGHTVGVAVFYPGGPLEEVLRAAGVPIHSLDKGTRWNVGPFLYRLVKLVRRFRPDVLHGFLPVPNIVVVCIRGFIPFPVKIVWGIRASRLDFADYGWLTRLSYWLEARLSRFADLIIVNANAGKEYAASRGFPAERMVVIHNGIDTERFRPDKEARQRVRKEWKRSESELLIGIVARFDPMKGHQTFLRAAADLVQDFEHIGFVLVGDGPLIYLNKIHKLAQELGLRENILWVGARGDMPSVYNALDILVSSSSYGEGFPNVIGEAMACGVPCVVTDVGDSSLIVGNLGQVVMPRDPRGLANGLKSVLSGDLKVEPQELRRQILDSYSHEALIRGTEKTLKEICGH